MVRCGISAREISMFYSIASFYAATDVHDSLQETIDTLRIAEAEAESRLAQLEVGAA